MVNIWQITGGAQRESCCSAGYL